MRRVHIFLAFLLVLATAEEEENALTAVDVTKLVNPGTAISEVAANVRAKILQIFSKYAYGTAPPEDEFFEIRKIFGDAYSSREKIKEAISEIESEKGPAYTTLTRMIADIMKAKIASIVQMINLGLGEFIYLPSGVWDQRWSGQGSGFTDRDKKLAKERLGSGTTFPQGYEASMRFLDMIGQSNIPYWSYRGDGNTKTYYALKSEGVIDEYVKTATKAVFEALPKEKLEEFAKAINDFDEITIRSYAGETDDSEIEPKEEPAVEPPTPESEVEPPNPESEIASPNPEPEVEPTNPESEIESLSPESETEAESPNPESEVESSNPDSEPESLTEIIDEIVEEVKEENAKEEVTDTIENLINGELISDEEGELAEATGLADLSEDELEEVIEKIEETADDDEIGEEAQCGESTDEVEDALTDSLVEKVKDKLSDATRETIDHVISGDEQLDDLEEDIADEFELKLKGNEYLEIDRNALDKGEGDLPEKILKIIEELLPEELKEIEDGKDEDNEEPIEELIESVIEDIPEEVIDIIEEVPKEDIKEVIEDVVDKSTEDLEDKHEKDLEKEAVEVTGEPYECSCDCDRK